MSLGGMTTNSDFEEIGPSWRPASLVLPTPAPLSRLQAALLERLRSKWMSGTFSWYDWALDQILWLNFRQLAAPLRDFYEENKHHYQPLGSHRWGMKLLHAIHRLGGEITAEEIEALRGTGRLP